MSVGGFGTWAAMSPPTTNTTTTAFTGGPWTFTRTAVASSAETIVTFKISDDSTSNVIIKNASASDSLFVPHLQMQVAGSSNNTLQSFEVQTDSGSTAAHAWRAQTIAGAAVTSRPPFEWRNWTNTVLQMLPLNSGANSCLSWGTQSGAAPAFTTRSAGTRLVLLSNIGASTVDYGIGYESSHVWFSCEAAQNARGFKWYAGTTLTARLSGDGILSLGTNTTNYARLGQKLETNTSANSGGAALNTWSASGGEASILDFNRSKSATIGTHTVVGNGDQLGSIFFRGSDGTSFQNAAQIRSEVDGTPGTTDMPGRLLFSTTPDGSTTLTERMRITNAGDVGIGKTPTTGIILDVNGQLGLKSYTVATLPSASVQAGAIVYVSDAGGNGPCIAVSNGTNWKRCDNTSTTVS